ncbi:hypothetical protein Tco_1349247, partial [Tanacetum coccineum]
RSLEFNGETKNGDPPREFSRDAIMTQLARLPTRVKGKHPRFGGVKIKCNVLVELNWTKRSIFYELEYWSFHTLKHNLDVMHIEKNVLEIILNTLLMNDKSKDTSKARQDLKILGIRSGLWLGQNKNGKCSKPQAAYSFTPADRKKFCQFIKGVKLPDGFGSNFKHKVTDNDTNITGLKSHDCHIMMQRLLPYGLQQYLPPDVAKPLIELCLFFKQICSQTLMVDDMLKAQSKVIDILCNLELIYPPAFFDIMIHLVIHLPLEAIFGGPIRPRWMYPFERYMKKLKNYVRNKAKPEGSIAEGYVAEEALTFSSHYFRDVTTKFNRPDRNVDCPPPTCQFQVFKSLCKSIGLRSVIRIDHQELKKVIWYVLHNSPEIDTYRAKFKIEFPNKDMKEEFPGWFGKQIRQRHVDNDPGVNESSELFALACGPSQTPISVNSCVVNGVRFVVHSRDERRTTQNSGICSPGPDGEMYYGQLEQILEFSYLSFKTVLFRVKWFDTSNKGRIQNFVIRNNITQIKANGEAFKNDQYILATQVKQCFYLEDMARRPLGWKVVEHVSHKKFLNGGVIVVEDDPDVIHVDNSSDLALSTSLNDLEIAALHIDGQSIDVDAPPDIIDVAMAEEDAFLVDDVECGLCVYNTDAEIGGRFYSGSCYSGSNLDKGKYMAKDASSKKFLVSNFNNYKMVDSRPVMKQFKELLRILGQYTQHGLKMDESIFVSSIIDKLPPSWKDFKHTLKHGKDDLSLVQLGSHLRIEESLRAQDSDKGKGKEVTIMLKTTNKTKERNVIIKNTVLVRVPTRNLSWNVGSVVRLVTSRGIVVVVIRRTQMLVVREKGLRTIPKTKVDAIAWWIDSGATTHVCKDRCWFKTYEPVEDGSVLYMGDDHFAPVHGKGSVVLEFSSGKSITLFNVLYVPKLCKKLIYGPVLNKCGYKQVYESDKYVGSIFLNETLIYCQLCGI